jgi:hypothetical protein
MKACYVEITSWDVCPACNADKRVHSARLDYAQSSDRYELRCTMCAAKIREITASDLDDIKKALSVKLEMMHHAKISAVSAEVA